MKIDLLLGMNILKRTSIDFIEKKIYFNHDESACNTKTCNLNIDIVSRNIFDTKNDHITMGNCNENPIPQDTTKEDENINESARNIDESMFSIHLLENMTLKKNSITIVSIKASRKLKENQGINLHHTELKPGIVIPNILSTVKQKIYNCKNCKYE